MSNVMNCNKMNYSKDDSSLECRYKSSMDFKITKKTSATKLILYSNTSIHGDPMHNDLVFTDYRDQVKSMNVYKIVIKKGSNLHCIKNRETKVKVDAEMYIYHKSKDALDNEKVIICVPICKKNNPIVNTNFNNMSENATKNLERILNANKDKDKQGNIVKEIDVNSFIPYGKDYYTYDNSNEHNIHQLADSSCLNMDLQNTHLIVYSVNHAYIEVGDDTLDDIDSNDDCDISTFSLNWLKNKLGVSKLEEGFQNMDLEFGESDDADSDADDNDAENASNATSGMNNDMNYDMNSDKDDIYIDCRPTGNEGKVLYEEDLTMFKPKIPNVFGGSKTNAGKYLKDIITSPYFFFIIGLIIAVIYLKLSEMF